ncbi:MAG TPA: hypothetical protein VLF40_00975 [Candidatus Saccharimonadales bacterium]|nr:hypothetical protein [Candidatus Saccharimonadales bacterium]
MNTAFDILVIILSCTLFIFLVLAIVLTALVLGLVRALRKIVAKGERLVDSAEAIGETLKAHAGAANIVRVLMGFVSNFSNKGRRG